MCKDFKDGSAQSRGEVFAGLRTSLSGKLVSFASEIVDCVEKVERSQMCPWDGA